MTGIFLALYHFFKRRKILLALLLISWLATGAFFASKIQLKEDISDMLPGDDHASSLTGFFKNSKLTDRIIVTISSADSSVSPETLIEQVDRTVSLLDSSCKEYISSVQYKSDEESMSGLMDVIQNNLPLFLEDSDYARLDSVLTENGISQQVESNYKNLVSPTGFALRKYILSDPLGLSPGVFKKLEQFGSGEGITLYDNYFFSEDGKNALLFINPAFPSGEIEKNLGFFSKLNQITSDSAWSHHGIKVRYFGAPAVAAGNSERIRKDTTLTLTLTIILLIALFIAFFRNLKSPLIIMIPVILGALFSLSVIYIINGSLSLIALGAGSLILGIAVNYSLHFMTHLRFHPLPEDAIRDLTFPLTAGSLTTILGFLCLQFVNAPVLQDLGLYAAFSLMGAALATLIFLPHFTQVKLSSAAVSKSADNNFAGRIIQKFATGRVVFAVLVIITPVMFYFARDIKFETDMYKVNYMSDELKESEAFVSQFTSRYQKSIFIISEGSSLEEALESSEKLLPEQDQLKAEGKILSYTNISTLLPSKAEQQRRIDRWENYWSDSLISNVYKNLVTSGDQFKFKPTAFDNFKEQTGKSYQLLSADDESIIKSTLLDNFISNSDGKVTVTGLVTTKPENTELVYAAFPNNDNTIIFDRKYITDKLVEMVGDDFNFITLWTSLLVFAALLLIYGRIELAVISFLPMAVSWIWILGLMSIFGISFNIINIVLSTLIFALGDDFCIFTADSLQQGYARGIEKLKTSSTSITLSAIATMTGTGMLIFAQHPALKSIAAVSIIGICSVWFMSQVIQPVLFRFLISNPAKSGHQPYTFLGILKSIFSFSYFTIGSLLITLIGFILLKLIPGKSTKRKYIYHLLMQRFTWSLIYIMRNVKKRIINENGEDFSKPAIVIANHSSVLDILLTVMLHPKIILVTNQWVWNSPVFGSAIRMAEYYPVTEGSSKSTDQLAAKVAEGYSIIIFPEGTRSPDGNIGRFHKGAFLLAEQLKIDILPLLIHGAGQTLTKGFFYLKDGSMTLKFLPRIASADLALYGETYRERAKNISKEFKRQHALLTEELETPTYFRNMLFSNYLYKGPVLEWYMKVKVRLEKDYTLFNDLVPRHGKIVDLGCGYGFLSYMLSLTSKNRLVTGVDYDSEKITIAQNGYLRKDNLTFESSDITTFNFREADAVIINDVLHYLHPDAQIKLLIKCVDSLSENGMMIIRDGVSELTDRHRGTKLTELFSTRLLRFNKTEAHGLNFISGAMIKNLAKEHNLSIQTIDNTKYTSNVTFVLRKTNLKA